MTEPIDKWKEEARQYIESIPSSMDDWNVCDIERAYIAAKMSQPVVELPGENPMIFGLSGFEKHELIEALTAAGIQYRTKGE